MLAGHESHSLQGQEKKEIMSAEFKGKIRRFSIETWVECRCGEAEKHRQVSLMTRSAGKLALWTDSLVKENIKKQNTFLSCQVRAMAGRDRSQSAIFWGDFKSMVHCIYDAPQVYFYSTQYLNLVVKVGKWIRCLEIDMTKVTYISATSN